MAVPLENIYIWAEFITKDKNITSDFQLQQNPKQSNVSKLSSRG